MTVRSSQAALVAALGAVAILIGIAGVLLLVMPQHKKSSQLSQQITEAESSLVVSHAAPTVAKPNVDATDLYRLREAMPDSDEMAGILIDLSGIAKASSVSIASVHPSAKVSLSGYWAIPIVVVVNGKYAGVTSFLARLRAAVQTSNGRLAVSGRLFVANQVAFQSGDNQAVQATLNLDAFEYGAPLVTAPPAGSGTTTTSTTTTTSG